MRISSYGFSSPKNEIDLEFVDNKLQWSLDYIKYLSNKNATKKLVFIFDNEQILYKFTKKVKSINKKMPIYLFENKDDYININAKIKLFNNMKIKMALFFIHKDDLRLTRNLVIDQAIFHTSTIYGNLREY